MKEGFIYGKGIHPQRILTVTYTVAATRDMKQRFISMFGEEYARQLEFRTINGISQKILQYFAESNHTTVYDDCRYGGFGDNQQRTFRRSFIVSFL